MAARRAARRKQAPWWIELPREELLDVRLCDLGLTVAGTALERRVERLYEDLARRGLRFRPHVWLSTDWFTPDRVTGFAIPFYLAHPRLCALEHAMMFEVEGGGHAACMRILRHECGHAIDNAYRLRRRKAWREAFGSPSEPYRDSYLPRLGSRDHVQHLDLWYAQSHPLEDFAETFAVWLTPRAQWREQYRSWPALRKLECVDALMGDVADQVPPVRSRAMPDSLPRVRQTLRAYYQEKQALYGRDPATSYDRALLGIFAEGGRRGSAGKFLQQYRVQLRSRVSDLSSQPRYVVDQILRILIVRCRQLGLRLARTERATLVDVAVLVAVLSTRSGRGVLKEVLR